MIRTYTNASDEADSARSAAGQAMVDERFAPIDAARNAWLDERCREVARSNQRCRICGGRMNHIPGRRFPGVCGKPKCKRHAARLEVA